MFAGAVCRQILRRRGVSVGGHILRIADAADEAFDPVNLSSQLLEELAARPFSLLRAKAEPPCETPWRPPGWQRTAWAAWWK